MELLKWLWAFLSGRTSQFNNDFMAVTEAYREVIQPLRTELKDLHDEVKELTEHKEKCERELIEERRMAARSVRRIMGLQKKLRDTRRLIGDANRRIERLEEQIRREEDE